MTRTKAPQIQVRGTMLELPGSPQVETTPVIRHAVEHPASLGFADLESFLDGRIRHTLDVVIDYDVLSSEFGWDQGGQEASAQAWSRLEGIVVTAMASQFQEGRFVVAQLIADEFPAYFQLEADWPWHDTLDAIDDDTRAVRGAIDELRRSGRFRSALNDGSLFHICHLGVHPAFRGHRIGARLIGHALWSLTRANGDLAVLLAIPTGSPFDNQEPTQTVGAIGRLVRYYESMGFLRTDPHAPIVEGSAVPMVVQFGEVPPSVFGLG